VVQPSVQLLVHRAPRSQSYFQTVALLQCRAVQEAQTVLVGRRPMHQALLEPMSKQCLHAKEIRVSTAHPLSSSVEQADPVAHSAATKLCQVVWQVHHRPVAAQVEEPVLPSVLVAREVTHKSLLPIRSNLEHMDLLRCASCQQAAGTGEGTVQCTSAFCAVSSAP
jgi:hypothetical protein